MVMHATLLRLRCAPGQATEVARLIRAEYVPQFAEVEGVLSYTLVHSGQDEVASIGVFTSQAGAMQASELAQSWVRERLADLGAAPVEAIDGEVLLNSAFGS
jgi:quinol monooxygenase YgiN